MIPKIIWQTYKDPFNQLPQHAKDCAQTWKDLNPEYKYMYMDDNEAKSFILHEFGEDWLSIFNNYPIGVMRGDLWRYMIINKYGGVYADLDTVCNKPISSWIKKDYDLIVSDDEDLPTYTQFAFAGSPNNKITEIVLELIKQASQKINIEDKQMVHYTTGVDIWTKAINICKEQNEKIYIYGGGVNAIFNGNVMTHLGTSKGWHGNNYIQWTEEIKYFGDK